MASSDPGGTACQPAFGQAGKVGIGALPQGLQARAAELRLPPGEATIAGMRAALAGWPIDRKQVGPAIAPQAAPTAPPQTASTASRQEALFAGHELARAYRTKAFRSAPRAAQTGDRSGQGRLRGRLRPTIACKVFGVFALETEISN